jgi:hypothetical protein
MVWAIDRLGRSLQNLLATMQTLEASKLRAKGIERSIAVESECDRRPIGKIGYLGKDPTRRLSEVKARAQGLVIRDEIETGGKL